MNAASSNVMKTVNTVNDIFIEHFAFRNGHIPFIREAGDSKCKKKMSNLTPLESFNDVTVPIFSNGPQESFFVLLFIFLFMSRTTFTPVENLFRNYRTNC